ncbi:signal peptidase I [Leucobacter viscericola]|uniref:Signal peptidase I n=1 Tax=Leucobacter viscericola TaxID=2714935 RepID=A0A6G7XIE7_9MICO|nr:signal peptidase I [Leucobacter viscericola]QIK64380.1 signal peptidase I [Leucobacter viscericola]
MSEVRVRPQRRGVSAFLSALGTGVMAGLTVLFVGVIFATVAIPFFTGSTALTVKTSSMEPAVPPGTMIVVHPIRFSEIEPGMIVTYQLRSGEPTLITHRVTQQQKLADGTGVLITKGDANPAPDVDPIIETQVRGTVRYAIPYIGWVTTLFAGETRTAIVTLVVAGLLLYAAWMLILSVRERRKMGR